jgi:hypothetical protein
LTDPAFLDEANKFAVGSERGGVIRPVTAVP